MSSPEKKLSPAAPRILISSVRVLALCAALAMMITGELDRAFIGTFIVFFLIAFKVEKINWLSRILGMAQPFLAVLFLAVAFIDFFVLSKSFLLSVAHFLLCLQGLRLTVLKTSRENLGCVLLSSMMMISASTLSVDWTFFLFLNLFLPMVIWCLIIHHVSLEAPEQYHWQKLLPTLKKASGLALLLTFLCSAFVFIVFPRFNFRGFRGQFLQPVHKTGFSDQVNLNKEGKIFSDSSIVMRVEINPEEKDRWDGYLRGATLDEFDGVAWKKINDYRDRVYRTGLGDIDLPAKERPRGFVLRQNIFLESLDTSLLFAAFKPIHLKLDRPFVLMGDDGSLQRGLGDTWRLRYEVDSVLPTKKAVQKSQTQKRLKFFSCLKVPGSVKALNLRSFLNPIVKNETRSFERAHLIENYLRTTYSYTLQLPRRSSKLPLGSFLFEDKKGHCEYFASALCMLLRTDGIPCRMVTGFLAKEWNQRGGYYVVRMSDAHAWVEAYFETEGWVRLDGSPRDQLKNLSLTGWRRRLMDSLDVLNLTWNRTILSYDMERQVELYKSFNAGSQSMSSRFSSTLDSVKKFFRFDWKNENPISNQNKNREFSKKWGKYFFLFFGVAIFGFSLHSWRRHQTSKPHWLYTWLIRYLKKHGAKYQEGSTLNELISSTKEKLSPHLDEVQFLAHQYYESRFGLKVRFNSTQIQAIRHTIERLKNC